MAAKIVGGLIDFLVSKIPNVTVWDGEIPRQGVSQVDINLTATTPVFRLDMLEKFVRTESFENAYDDEGPIGVNVWATTRRACEDLLTTIESFMVNSGYWDSINIGSSPFQVYKILLTDWSCKQLEGARTKESQLIYAGEQNYDVAFHGSIETRVPA